MSGDLPLAEPARRLSDRTAHVWQRIGWYDLYFSTVAAAVAVFAAAAPDGDPPGSTPAALAAVAVMAAWYAGFGRRLIRDDDLSWRGLVYQAGVLVLFAVAVDRHGGTSFLLFALCPQAYMTMRFGPATAVVVVLNAIPTGVFLLRGGGVAAALAGPAPIGVLVTAFSVLFGWWVDRIMRQSADRAALIEELAATRAEVARLSREAGVAAERQRLAAELHDTVAQGLSSVVMLLQAADAELEQDLVRARRHLELAERAARDNLADVREVVAGLTPAALSSASLPEALDRLVARFAEETGVAAGAEVAGPARPLPTPVEVVLLRAAQEALANVRKHAGASTVRLGLAYRPDAVVLTVTDDGRGAGARVSGAGFGLAAMRARVAEVAGELTVDGASGSGTTVTVEVPA